jgi:hypothetical protein
MTGMTTIVRKAQTGEPGNSGEFGTHERPEGPTLPIDIPEGYTHFAGSGDEHNDGDVVDIDGDLFEKIDGEWFTALDPDEPDRPRGSFGSDYLMDDFDRTLISSTGTASGTISLAQVEVPTRVEGEDEPADHTDIDRYFAGGLDQETEDTWAEHGVSLRAPDAWKELAPTTISPRGLVRTQDRIVARHLARAAQGGEPEGGDLPLVIRFDGRDFVIDGHHRIANAVHNDHATIDVKFIDFGVRGD